VFGDFRWMHQGGTSVSATVEGEFRMELPRLLSLCRSVQVTGLDILRYEICEQMQDFFYLIPFYLQAVQIHSANGVKLLEA
jgi:hypothetical protein